jgi:hypothetical protein
MCLWQSQYTVVWCTLYYSYLLDQKVSLGGHNDGVWKDLKVVQILRLMELLQGSLRTVM